MAAALYACTLPLWEGWDEAFHYGRVENIAVQHELGVLNKSTISAEIDRSLRLVPLTRLLVPLVPGSVSFEDWHRLSPLQQADLHAQLLQVSPALRYQTSSRLNYEAQQAPLTYLLMAPLDMLLGSVQLVPRVLALRLIQGLLSMAFIYFGLVRLARALEIGPHFRAVLLFCALSVQMLWASIVHVGNDGFAIALVVWFLAMLAEGGSVVVLGALLGIGLLTKAYFLSFVPVFFVLLAGRLRGRRMSWRRAAMALMIPIAVAGPWYLRNQVLYGSFSGTQETVAGVTFSSAMRAVPRINWFNSAMKLWRDSLWSGNASFTAFSRVTLQAEEALMLLGLVLVVVNYKRIRAREIWLWAAVACFGLGLFYQTCVTWAASNGLSVSPEPWYGEGVLLGVWALLIRGFEGSPRIGRVATAALCVLATWIAAATFLVKLLPQYGGGLERGTARAVITWWSGHPAQDLAAVMPAPPSLIFGLLGLYLGLLLVTAGIVMRSTKART